MSNWDGRERECDICWESFLPLDSHEDVCPACLATINDYSLGDDEDEEEGEE